MSLDVPYSVTRAGQGELLIAGTISHELIPEFDALLQDEVSGAPVTLDLSAVTYLPTLALSSIVKAWKLAGTHQLTVRARSGTISQRVLAMAQLPHLAV